MYREFYNLKLKPFQISSDPAFLWLGENHQEALATLRYGILDNKGFLLLTGDVGTGKTTLINTLKISLGKDVICTAVPDPSLDTLDFYNYVARGFGFDQGVTSKGRFLSGFSQFLHTAHANNKKVLLIIDEAQLLTQDLLEEIRLLSNVELAETKLLNIFFIGQNEFNEILSRPQNRAVRQRLTLNYNLEPLSLAETDDYIKHRLKIAGTTERLFGAEAVREIYNGSQGFPRRINVLCDHALLTGYVRDKRTMDAAIIQECIRELDIPVKPRQANTATAPPVAHSQPATQPTQTSQATQVPPASLAQAPGKTPAATRPGRRLAHAGFIMIALLLLAGFFLFPEGVQTLVVTADHYLGGFTAALSGRLADDVPSPPVNSRTLPSGDVPTPPGLSSQPLQAPGDTLKTGATSHPVDGFLANVPPQEEQAPKETVEPETLAVVPQVAIVPPVLEKPVLEKMVVVRFLYSSNDFSEQGMAALSRFADTLMFYPRARLSIIGYTDTYGNQAYNKKLSEFRANIVKSFLLGKGVLSEQMESSGLGSENPIESNDSAWGRMMNRRVEVMVVSNGEGIVNKN
ncbi:MAG: AAA family ATPase [Desulfobacterium sp.]|nr:AAA family ATPase [Desulfobacterium sp.]